MIQSTYILLNDHHHSICKHLHHITNYHFFFMIQRSTLSNLQVCITVSIIITMLYTKAQNLLKKWKFVFTL